MYLDEFKTWDERDAERPLKPTLSGDYHDHTTTTTVTDGRPSTLPSGKKRPSQEIDSGLKQQQRRSESISRQQVVKEGLLTRKHEWEAHERKAQHRAWEKLYCVLTGSRLQFYKDQKHYKTSRTYSDDLLFDNLTNVLPATDYRKKTNVFRVRLAGGNEYLFHAKDDLEMNEWIQAINTCIPSTSTSHIIAQIPLIAVTSSSSPRHQPPTIMTSSTSGVEITSTQSPPTAIEQKSRTLPTESQPISSSTTTGTTTSTSGKKKSGGFFSMKRK
ncbi:unnamed protein product [Didymodactylos carnosus]|uniref:PH domain-containing protein n=2 Tax=Didymodactylos carnosus TaxID=1234261 RepID=A0A815IBD0_9BILA|nr:unnamed protein product [Didymodactylos carnosus]CAF4244033.1 unnamed protein product [Didymodactylos carnosus]